MLPAIENREPSRTPLISSLSPPSLPQDALPKSSLQPTQPPSTLRACVLQACRCPPLLMSKSWVSTTPLLCTACILSPLSFAFATRTCNHCRQEACQLHRAAERPGIEPSPPRCRFPCRQSSVGAAAAASHTAPPGGLTAPPRPSWPSAISTAPPLSLRQWLAMFSVSPNR
nr:uncharacterized protein LOC127309233 [Lolium perenne]